MYTPVDEATRAKITTTSGHVGKDVVDRVNSAIAFVEFVLAQEVAFVEMFRSQYSTSPAERVNQLKWLDSKKIPCVANRMAKHYLNRVKAIRELAASDRYDWWNDCEARLTEILRSTRETLI